MDDREDLAQEFLPVPGSCFRVEINGRKIGISSATPPKLAEGALGDSEKTPDTITIRRAVGRSREFFEWRRAVVRGKDDRRDVTLELLDGPGGRVLATWRFVGCKPIRWQGPALDALSHTLAYEEIELAYKDLKWIVC